jgi:hypothetical protein
LISSTIASVSGRISCSVCGGPGSHAAAPVQLIIACVNLLSDRVKMMAAHASTTLRRAARVRKAAGSLPRPAEAMVEERPMALEGVLPIR